MNKLFLVLLVLGMTLAEARAQVPASSGEVQTVERLMAAQQQAWNEGDLERFMAAYWNDPALKFIGKNGVTKGWDATLARYQKSYPDRAAMGTLTFTLLSHEKLGAKHLLTIGKWQLTREKDTLEGHFSLIWKKIRGQWRIIADHSS